MSHYFDEAPSLPSERATISLTIRGKERDFETAPGVFARDGLDKATAILLDYCDPGSRLRLGPDRRNAVCGRRRGACD